MKIGINKAEQELWFAVLLGLEQKPSPPPRHRRRLRRVREEHEKDFWEQQGRHEQDAETAWRYYFWALLLKGQKGGGQSGHSWVIYYPSTITTCHWPGYVWERAKGQTQVLEAEPRLVLLMSYYLGGPLG